MNHDKLLKTLSTTNMTLVLLRKETRRGGGEGGREKLHFVITLLADGREPI